MNTGKCLLAEAAMGGSTRSQSEILLDPRLPYLDLRSPYQALDMLDAHVPHVGEPSALPSSAGDVACLCSLARYNNTGSQALKFEHKVKMGGAGK